MDGLIHFPLFLFSAMLIIIAPGPDFIYVTTRGISEGNKAGLLSVLGISVGLLVHTLFAALGLSAIIHASRVAYLVIKYIGAAYLVYIGVKILLSKKASNGENNPQLNGKQKNVFKQGVLTNVFNPKAIVTFMAFLPQFVDVAIQKPVLQFTALGLVLSTMAVLWFGLVGYFAGSLGNFIRKNDRIQSWIKYLSGSIMIALGLKLATSND